MARFQPTGRLSHLDYPFILERQESLPGERPRGISVYAGCSNPDDYPKPLVRIRHPDRTGGVTLPVAHEKGRDLRLGSDFFGLAFPSPFPGKTAVLVVVANIVREQAFQVPFVNCDDEIQEITAATPYPTLCDSILPRTFERSADRTHAEGSNRCRDFQSILGITIKDEEPRSGSKWKCFSQLLDDPRACRMLCDIELQDATTISTDDENSLQHAESDCRNREEVHRGTRFPVIAEKGKPALAGSGSRCARFIQRETVRSETSKLSMRSSPWMRGAPHVGF